MRILGLVTCALALAASTGAAAAAGSGSPPPDTGLAREALPDTVADWAGFNARLWRDGRVFIGGQPDSSALCAAAERGITCVINLRTPAEMNDRKRVPFDEALRRGEAIAISESPFSGLLGRRAVLGLEP